MNFKFFPNLIRRKRQSRGRSKGGEGRERCECTAYTLWETEQVSLLCNGNEVALRSSPSISLMDWSIFPVVWDEQFKHLLDTITWPTTDRFIVLKVSLIQGGGGVIGTVSNGWPTHPLRPYAFCTHQSPQPPSRGKTWNSSLIFELVCGNLTLEIFLMKQLEMQYS